MSIVPRFDVCRTTASTSPVRSRSERAQIAVALVGEAGDRAGQRGPDRAPHEQPVDERRDGRAALEVIVEPERDQGVLAGRLEADLLGAAQALVLDRERLTLALHVGGDALDHASAPARL